MDSNHRSREAADLQSAPFNHSGTYPFAVNKTNDNNSNHYTLLYICCQSLFYIYKAKRREILTRHLLVSYRPHL